MHREDGSYSNDRKTLLHVGWELMGNLFNGKMRSRNEYIDCVKAIGIVLVVLGHTFGGGLFALKTYHMPLFFFVAGLLMNEEENYGSFLKKRIYQLYIPFLLYEGGFLCIHNFLYGLGMVSNDYILPWDLARQLVHIVCFDNCEILLAPIWFVTVMFFSGIISKIIMSFFSRFSFCLGRRKLPIIIFMVSVCLLYGGMLNGRRNIWNMELSFNCPQVINVSFVAAGYMLIGYLLRSFFLSGKWKDYIFRFAAFLIVCFGGIIIFERRTRLISDMRSNSYTYIGLAPIFAMTGIAMIFLAASCILKMLQWNYLQKIKMFIMYMGRHTFVIMCLHPLAFKMVGWVQVNYFGYDKELLPDWGVVGHDVLWLVANCMAGIVIPLVSGYFVDFVRSRFINNACG